MYAYDDVAQRLARGSQPPETSNQSGLKNHRASVFRPDTQDGLVLLMIVMIPLLPAGEIAELDLGRIALRSAALVYCCEYILSCAPHARHLLLNAAAVGGMVVLGV